MLTSIVWRFYALTFLLAVVSCSASRSKRTPEAANGRPTLSVRDTPPAVPHRVRRDGIIQTFNKQEVLDKHNEYRRKEGSSNMKKLKWNDFLADMASEWAKGCVFKHGQPPRDQAAMPYKTLGQNIAANGADRGLPFSIDRYMLEKKDFDYDKNQCQANKDCGHYLQVVWPTAEAVGCSYAKCDDLVGFASNSFFSVCNYGPAMGVVFGQLLYLKGRACSACDGSQWCSDGLCVQNCKDEGGNCGCGSACQHCGTVDSALCQCKCAAGYMGPECSAACTEKTDCPKYSKDLCKTNEFILEQCPILCGTCTAAPAGASARNCPTAYGSYSRAWSMPRLKMSMQLLVEIVLLLCLQNNI